jgi:hypothetical protein
MVEVGVLDRVPQKTFKEFADLQAGRSGMKHQAR